FLVAVVFLFFFQAEDGIRDFHVTGVQTCALPISAAAFSMARPPATEPVKLTWSILPEPSSFSVCAWLSTRFWNTFFGRPAISKRSEERRVGKESGARWPLEPDQSKAWRQEWRQHE